MERMYAYDVQFAHPRDADPEATADLETRIRDADSMYCVVEATTRDANRLHQRAVVRCDGPLSFGDWMSFFRRQIEQDARRNPPPQRDVFHEYNSEPLIRECRVIYTYPSADTAQLQELFDLGVIKKIELETGCSVKRDPTGRFLSICHISGDDSAAARAVELLRRVCEPTVIVPETSHITIIENPPLRIKLFLKRLEEVQDGTILARTLLASADSTLGFNITSEGMHIMQFFRRNQPTASWNLVDVRTPQEPLPLVETGVLNMWNVLGFQGFGTEYPQQALSRSRLNGKGGGSSGSAPTAAQRRLREPRATPHTPVEAPKPTFGRVRRPKGIPVPSDAAQVENPYSRSPVQHMGAPSQPQQSSSPALVDIPALGDAAQAEKPSSQSLTQPMGTLTQPQQSSSLPHVGNWLDSITRASSPAPSRGLIGGTGPVENIEGKINELPGAGPRQPKGSVKMIPTAPVSESTSNQIDPLPVPEQADVATDQPNSQHDSSDEVIDTLQAESEVDTRLYRNVTLHRASGIKKTVVPSTASPQKTGLPAEAHRMLGLKPLPVTDAINCLRNDAETAYEKARAFRGRIEIKFEIGRILVDVTDQEAHKQLKEHRSSPKAFDSLLTKLTNDDIIKTHFTAALTSEPRDTHYILGLCEKSPERLFTESVDDEYASAKGSCTFQLICKDRADKMVVIHTSGNSPTDYCSEKPAETLASTVLHHPDHSWDARMLVFGLSSEHGVNQEAIRELMDNMYVNVPPGKTMPLVQTKATLGVLHVEDILVRRSYSFTNLSQLDPDIALEISEYQSMVVMTNQDNMIMALPSEHKRALAEGKIWYEVCLKPLGSPMGATHNTELKLGEIAKWKVNDIVDADLLGRLQALTSALIQRMDVVGRENRGPGAKKPKMKFQPVEEDSFW